MRAAAKWSVRGLLVLVLLGGCWVGYAVGQQWFFRWRVSRLLEDVRKLEVRKSDWADVQRLMTRWGKWGHYEGTCDASHCSYRVWLAHRFPERWYPVDGSPFREHGRRWLADLGVHPTYALAGFELRRDQVVAKGVSLIIDDPFHDPMESVGVDSEEGSRLDEIFSRGDAVHPYRTLSIVKYGYVQAATTPKEDGDVKDRLMQVRVACITAIWSCRNSEELLPEASRELAGVKPVDHQLPDCSIPLSVAARDATGVYVADIVGVTRYTRFPDGTAMEEPQWIAKAQITQVLKGNFDAVKNKPLLFNVLELAPGMKQADAYPYRSVIVMGWAKRPRDQNAVEQFEMTFCDRVEATSANVAEAKRGVAEDYDPTLHWE